MLDGHVFDDATFHSFIDAAGEWRIRIQLAPKHVPPDWPDGAPQQVYMDLHVKDLKQAHEQAMRLGARLLQAGDLESDEGHQAYADPAGHPFCIGWGQLLADERRQRLCETVAFSPHERTTLPRTATPLRAW